MCVFTCVRADVCLSAQVEVRELPQMSDLPFHPVWSKVSCLLLCKPGWLTHSGEHWRGRGYRHALLRPARLAFRDLNSGLHTSMASTLTPEPSPRPSSTFLEYSIAVSSNVCGLCSFFPVDLLGLLNWRSNSQNIKHNLKKLMEVDGGEIVKVWPCVLHVQSHKYTLSLVQQLLLNQLAIQNLVSSWLSHCASLGKSIVFTPFQ